MESAIPHDECQCDAHSNCFHIIIIQFHRVDQYWSYHSRVKMFVYAHLWHKQDSKKKCHNAQSLHRDYNRSHTCILHCKDGCHSDCDSKEEGVCGQSDQLGLPQLRYVDLPVLHSKHTANDGQHQFVAGQDNEGDVGVARHAVNVLLKRGRLQIIR